MNFFPTILKDSYIIQPLTKGDERGWFMRTYCKELFKSIGHTDEWVQMNHSHTKEKGTLRGMHFQLPPYEEVKLVRCIAGKVYDVIIDLRKQSATYLQWFGIELSAQNKHMLYIPKGFAHGFQTLSNDAELVYLHSTAYNSQFESGVVYNDPKVGIQWPLPVINLSQRDLSHKLL